MKNPWKKVSTKIIYDNPWITVVEDQVINPAGNPGIYGTTLFKNLAIGIIPLDDELNTWLVGQYRYPLDEYSWEIPMGGGTKEIDAMISAQRELKEETGLIAKNWKKIMRIHTSNSVTNEEGFVFVARQLEQGATEFEDTEDLQIKKIKLSEAVKMVMNGEITDSISMAGILVVQRLLDNNQL